MQFTLGQSVAFVTHAKFALAGQSFNIDPEHPYVGTKYPSEFRLKGDEEDIIATNPAEWFSYLKDQGFNQAGLARLPSDPKDLNFVGFGLTRIAPVTFAAHKTTLWTKVDRDEVRDGTKLRIRAWTGLDVPNPPKFEALSLDQAETNLHLAISRLLTFQKEHRPKDADFGEFFQFALDSLNTGHEALPPSDYAKQHDDTTSFLYPPNYNEQAVRLMRAVNLSWLYGAMGSWNDWGSKNKSVEEQFEAVSMAHMTSCNQALETACDFDLRENQ